MRTRLDILRFSRLEGGEQVAHILALLRLRLQPLGVDLGELVDALLRIALARTAVVRSPPDGLGGLEVLHVGVPPSVLLALGGRTAAGTCDDRLVLRQGGVVGLVAVGRIKGVQVCGRSEPLTEAVSDLVVVGAGAVRVVLEVGHQPHPPVLVLIQQRAVALDPVQRALRVGQRLAGGRGGLCRRVRRGIGVSQQKLLETSVHRLGAIDVGLQLGVQPEVVDGDVGRHGRNGTEDGALEEDNAGLILDLRQKRLELLGRRIGGRDDVGLGSLGSLVTPLLHGHILAIGQ